MIAISHLHAMRAADAPTGKLIISGYRQYRRLGVRVAPAEDADKAPPLVLNFDKHGVEIDTLASEDLVVCLTVPFEFRVSSQPEEHASSHEADALTNTVVSTESSIGVLVKGPNHVRLSVNTHNFTVARFTECEFWVCYHWSLVVHPNKEFEEILFDYNLSVPYI